MAILNLSAFSRVPFVDLRTGFLTREALQQQLVLQDRVGGATSLTAVNVANVPAGGIAAVNVQAAIDELDLEKEATGTAAGLMAAHTAALDPHPQYALDTDLTNLVPNTRTVNGKALNANITLTAADVGAGTGSVTTVSVVSANGFGGSVATPGTTPAITMTTTVTGLLKGDGTAVSAAAENIDFLPPNRPDATNALLIGSTYIEQAAPVSKGAAATLTIGELLVGIIQYTGAAAALTLPTGALIEPGLRVGAGIAVDQAFDFCVINTGSGTATMTTAAGLTLVGAMTVAAGVSAQFRVRKTAVNTYSVYRIA